MVPLSLVVLLVGALAPTGVIAPPPPAPLRDRPASVGQDTAAPVTHDAPTPASQDTGAWPTDFHAWTSSRDFAKGEFAGAVPVADAVTLPSGAAEGSWTSPWYTTPSAFTEAVPSWQANTPGDSWVEVQFQVRTATADSTWFTMAQWAFGDNAIQRQTVESQSDAVARISTDTLFTRSGHLATGYRLRTILHSNGNGIPTVRQLASTASEPGALPSASTPIAYRKVELPVPAYSQSTHSGEYKKYGGGGAVWCSPTSTAMVLSYWRTGPTSGDIASLPPDKTFDDNGRADGQVDWAAIHAWDYVYEGAGNWPFNTAYASAYGLNGSVRQYSTLRSVERWVRLGVPIVISIDWDNTDDDPTNDLDGSSITGTDGHLMVVVGFTASGDVIANDPASPSNSAVRHVYKRDQFERNWLRASDGTTYVISRV